MEEIWKDIKEYEGLYQVSNLGRVKSLGNNKSKKEKILKLTKNKGYLRVNLYKNNEVKNCVVHRIIANAFIENSNNYPYINHIDECKSNNNVNNLEWCTHKYNINYGSCIKRSAEKHKKAIYCLETNKIYNSLKQTSEELNIDRTNIGHVLKGRRKQTKGYTFRYANQILFTGVE